MHVHKIYVYVYAEQYGILLIKPSSLFEMQWLERTPLSA